MNRNIGAFALIAGAISGAAGQTAEQKRARMGSPSQVAERERSTMQQDSSPQARLRALGAVAAPGSVPVFYVASAKERALRLQQSLEAAHSWYEKQLKMKVPILLAVVDSAMWGQVQDLHAWMYFPPRPGPKLVVMRDQGQGGNLRDADRDHASGGTLYNEHVLFHDDGHILADAVNIRVGNKSVDELVATMFMIMYIRAERPDLHVLLKSGPAVPRPDPRYTSMADFDYLDNTNALPARNVIWLLGQMEMVLDSLSNHRTFSSVIDKLQTAFSTPAKHETPDEIKARLESVWQGFSTVAGSLIGPSTIPRTAPSACQKSEGKNERTSVVIQNESMKTLTVQLSDDQKISIPERSWRTFRVQVGESIKLPDGTCLVGREEPTLAVIRTE